MYKASALILGLLFGTPSYGFEQREVTCLAKAIYHEARGEILKGKEAVAHATLNRVDDERWPDTICRVVYQKGQFSWSDNEGKIEEWGEYKEAEQVAIAAMNGLSADPTKGAVYFFSRHIETPSWARKLKTVAVIGDHIFMK